MSAVGRLRLGERLLSPDDEARERRHARIRRVAVVVGVVALAAVLVYAVFPVRTVLDQWEARDRRNEQLDVLTPEIDRLERRRAELREPETIEEMARRDHGYVMPGEEAYTVLPAPEGGEG